MKTKRCFIIMPISDTEGYQTGHFGRVYEHIIKPACDIAGFQPVRADDIMITNFIALDIIKNIIECEMAICDLNSRNPNVLYELGIRQAFNLPVTLIKDQKTNRIFDIQGFRDVEYDESLRIDSVEEAIETLAEIIKNTYENTNEINSLISLLSIEPAKVTDKKVISTDTELIINTIQGLDKRIAEIENKITPTSRVPVSMPIEIQPIPDNVGDYLTKQEIEELKVGNRVFHVRFGIGEVLEISNPTNSTNLAASIIFESGKRRLLLKLTRLRKVI